MQAVIIGSCLLQPCNVRYVETGLWRTPSHERGTLLFNVEPFAGRCASHSVLHLCRVRFADGPLQDIYGTPDGHPSHEGQTARQRRSLNTSYPVDLTPHSIRMLEQELGESYRLSINRLKRR